VINSNSGMKITRYYLDIWRRFDAAANDDDDYDDDDKIRKQTLKYKN